ncbi:MAG: hypothetical protein N2053_10685, partial [Chitinispirillaceae bacterium]|nr:hypothetical protein [Chitinispirillaceae bacterium]
IVPSPNGTFMALVYLTSVKIDDKYLSNVKIIFLDSTANDTISKVPEFTMNLYPFIRWQNDSILLVIKDDGTYPRKIKKVGPFVELADTIGDGCRFPVTSSSEYYPNKGYLTFNGSSERVNISKEIPPAQQSSWCGGWY